ncbi:hypothetical protein [Niastella sp. OAS944]|uniref:hypothetical protein n=1 Tax=Niastella sp. OAS944 TaxID=2664089 RepID=UPI00348B8FDF|nr:putative membrane protein [Chitinophagaceae bacterium OAS944]
MAKVNKFRWDLYLIDLASRVGVFGAVVLSLLALFIIKGTAAQHKEFIDKFFLLKWGNSETFYHYFIITCLVVLFCTQFFYWKHRVKLKEERIAELINERDRLQNKLLKKH